MGSPPPAASVWVEWFDRFVARWLFALVALSALGLALLAVATHGWLHLALSLRGTWWSPWPPARSPW